METAIIGLARSGKTTIYNALTGQAALTGDAAGGRKQASLSEVKVPDERLSRLAALYDPKKLTYASVLFKDLPLEHDEEGGITAGSLADVRRADAVVIVIRAFSSDSVVPALKDSTPLKDLRKVTDSLVFGDFEIAEKRLERLDKEAKRDTREYHLLRQIVERLGTGKPLGAGFFAPEDARIFSGFGFLTAKPLFVVVNVGETPLPCEDLLKDAAASGVDTFSIRGDLEMEIAQLAEADQKDFLADLGLQEPAKNRFLRHVYSTLHLVSFFTVGEDECKAWSIHEGTTAVGAAGEIHSDLAKGFIRAEVSQWQDVLDSGDFAATKKANKLRSEGKEYVVRDGDVLLIRFNV
jgi:GTP-binding protein YchF